MIIKNFSKLATSKQKKHALEILDAGLQAALPKNSLHLFFQKNKIVFGKNKLSLSKFENIYTVAVGKAADAMTKVADSKIKIKKGMIVIPKGSKSVIKKKKFGIFYSGHPVPNRQSLDAGKTVQDFLKTRKTDDFVIFLVSGGASASLCAPEGISFDEKKYTTEILLKSGATIQEINCIRKHLSSIKGGKLVQGLPCKAIALILSDVIGSDLSSIASGLTYYDKTTFGDALNVIKKYRLEKSLPKRVIQRLKDGKLGKIQETPKQAIIKNVIVSQNSDCLKVMKKKAKKLGFFTKTIPCIFGDVEDVAKKLSTSAPKQAKSCLLFGGEPTVRVVGNGKGGRNQELVLRIFHKLQKSKMRYAIASVGTDGIDGNTKYAGAIAETSLQPYEKEIDTCLGTSNSTLFFKKYGGLIRTGYTHTNLMDIGIILS